MAIHRTRFGSGLSLPLSLLLAGALGGACLSCGGARATAKPAISAAAKPAIPPETARTGQATPHAARDDLGSSVKPDELKNRTQDSDEQDSDEDEDDAELVVSRDVVLSCPQMRLIRRHIAEIDPQMVWLAVLESLAECMGDGGSMAGQSVGVSGDEEHRHVVREVLASRGIAPTRVVAAAVSAEGAAECQGGFDCGKRVEITLAPGL